MTTTVISEAGAAPDHADGVFDEQPGGPPARGTLIVLTGRGETATTYHRFGRRIATDAYKVRVVTTDLDDLDATRARVAELLADDRLPAPKVLAGSDTGAALAAALLDESPADAAILAGLVQPGAIAPGDWDGELAARTACPTHRGVLSGDDSFTRGALSRPVPAELAITVPPAKPVLAVHGSADTVTPADDAFAVLGDGPVTRRRLVVGGRHDALNDATHRSVAATVILFLEQLKQGARLPEIVRPVGE